MSMFKKVLALLAVVALLAAVPVATSAEEAPVDPFAGLFSEEIKHSYTTEESIGNALAFSITLNVTGATEKGNHEYNEGSASFGDYTVVKMGAVLTNRWHENMIEHLIRGNADGMYTLDVEAKYLWDTTGETCSFAIRIRNIPGEPDDDQRGTAIFCRPYCVLKDKNGNETVVYVGNFDVSSFNKELYQAEPELTPVLDLSTLGNVDDKISVTKASAEYVALNENYKEGFKVSLTLSNTSANAISSNGDSITYSFKDKDGNEIGSQTVAVDVMEPGDTKDVEFYAPAGATAMEQSDANLNYVPDITLPAIGSDIDVTKKKNRIRVSAAEASFNEDGTIHVSLTFKNYTSNWITEETDYIRYRCYDSAGTVIDLDPKTSATYVTLYIGVIDTKKHPEKTFEFDLPANAASAKIISSKIVYWTEWS